MTPQDKELGAQFDGLDTPAESCPHYRVRDYPPLAPGFVHTIMTMRHLCASWPDPAAPSSSVFLN
jgi:hypothetical protein